jgi:hypothetical protein
VLIRRTLYWNRSVGGAYENLVVSSVGLKRFNLLVTRCTNKYNIQQLYVLYEYLCVL